MSEIKSAVELALERTKEIKVDKKFLQADEYRKKGMSIFSRGMEDASADIKAALKELSGDLADFVREGFIEALLSNVVLPQNDFALQRIETIQNVLKQLCPKSDAIKLLSQLSEIFPQYLRDRAEIKEEVKRQLKPYLQQKQQELAQQYGQKVKLDVEAMPEFVNSVKKNWTMLDNKYGAALGQVKEQIAQSLVRDLKI